MDRIITDLLNYAMDHNINLMITRELSPYTPSAVDTQRRSVVFNANWHNEKQLAFSLAHEIGHILNGDSSIEPLYFTPNKAKLEHGANALAIKMLIPFYLEDKEKSHIKAYDFMEGFGIPAYLEDVVIDELNEYNI
ncbi:ImmA/IrrE family metallo-endopeptidase [Latilactobacillus curvatus]